MHDKNLPPIMTNEEKEKIQFKVSAVDQEDGDKGFVGKDKVGMNEGMGLKDHFEETIDQNSDPIMDALDELEKNIDKVNRCIPPQSDKMSIRPPLTKEEKIRMINMIFPISLGDKVKNKFDEVGYVESVCIDHRGVLYLVTYQKHELIWESDYQIRKISPYSSNDGLYDGPDDQRPLRTAKTDIPDTRTVKTDPSQI